MRGGDDEQVVERHGKSEQRCKSRKKEKKKKKKEGKNLKKCLGNENRVGVKAKMRNSTLCVKRRNSLVYPIMSYS